MQQEEFQKTWEKIVAKTWSNPEFKDRLMKNPAGVLESHGIEIPSGMRLIVNESTKNMCYLTLPEKPEGELSKEELQSIAAGYRHSDGGVLA